MSWSMLLGVCTPNYLFLTWSDYTQARAQCELINIVLFQRRGQSACSGTAVYRGVPLKKVLKHACGGVQPECQHIEFIGADTYFKYPVCLSSFISTHSFLGRIMSSTTPSQSLGGRSAQAKKFFSLGRWTVNLYLSVMAIHFASLWLATLEPGAANGYIGSTPSQNQAWAPCRDKNIFTTPHR